jgi:hypothetical protein
LTNKEYLDFLREGGIDAELCIELTKQEYELKKRQLQQ